MGLFIEAAIVRCKVAQSFNSLPLFFVHANGEDIPLNNT